MIRSVFVLAAILIAGIFLVGCGVPSEVQQELTQLQTENSQLKTEKAQWQTEKSALEKRVDDLNKQLEELTGKALKDPTYAEAVALIKEDKTNEEVPKDHSMATVLVAENARKQGINCYKVIAQTPGNLQYGPIGFNFVGFNTTDRGWVYFCTTNICADNEAKIEIGKKLSESNPSWGDPGFDDTVISIHHVP
jgi:outer membrane murein-binding lipoprotein Lpp